MVKKAVKFVVFAAVGVGLIYASNWGLEKIGALSANPKMLHGVQAVMGGALIIGTKMFTKSWLMGLLIGAPLAIYGAYKFNEARKLSAPLPGSMTATGPVSTKGVGDYVNEHEAASLPAGSEVMDASTGATYIVGDPTMVGAHGNETMVGGFPLGQRSTSGVGGFPLAQAS